MATITDWDNITMFTVRVLCDSVEEAENPSAIIASLQGDEDFEDAESVALYVRDKSQGVKLVQTVLITPQTTEQEQANEEAIDAMNRLRAVLSKTPLLLEQRKLELFNLFYEGQELLSRAD